MIVVLLFLSWQIVAKTMAHVDERSEPERALAWDPHRAVALLELAERRVATPDPPAGEVSGQNGQLVPLRPSETDLADAQDLAERALRFDPLAPRALTDLGRIAESEGDASRAAALMELAGERALRDTLAQAWLVNHALGRGDFATALSHLDAILRTRPEALDKALPLLAAFISTPGAVVPLVSLVGTNPPWRSSFLTALAPRIKDRAALGRFYAELQAGPHPPSQQELRPYLDRLVKDGLFKEAYAAWVGTLPSDRRGDAGTLYNAGFRYKPSGSEFDWRITQSLGADIEIDGEAGKARILRIEFSGARVDFQNVSHLLVLQPGAYRLTGEVEAQELHTERGLWWRVFCAEPPNLNLGQTDLVADSTPWRPFTLTFDVPEGSCQAQVLQLELPARVALEKKIEGVVSYRNLAITSRIESNTSELRP